MCAVIPQGSGATTICDMTGELLHPRQLSTKRSHMVNILYPPRATCQSADLPKRHERAVRQAAGPVSNRNDIRKPSGTPPGMRQTIHQSADTPKQYERAAGQDAEPILIQPFAEVIRASCQAVRRARLNPTIRRGATSEPSRKTLGPSRTIR